MVFYKTYRECQVCQGVGITSIPGYPDEVCKSCGGKSKYEQITIDLGPLEDTITLAAEKAEEVRVLSAENQTKLVTLIGIETPTYKILEATKGSEYNDLSDVQKSSYSLYISAGKLDMRVGSKARDIFLAWMFPPGTLSYTAILAAIS
jgi:hypothetical protein